MRAISAAAELLVRNLRAQCWLFLRPQDGFSCRTHERMEKRIPEHASLIVACHSRSATCYFYFIILRYHFRLGYTQNTGEFIPTVSLH